MSDAQRILMLLPSLAGNGGIQRFNRTLLHASEASHCFIKAYSLIDTDIELQGVGRGNQTALIGTAGNRVKFVLAIARELLMGSWDVVVIGHINLARVVAALLSWVAGSRDVRTILIAHGIEIWGHIDRHRKNALRNCWRIAAVSAYTRNSLLAQMPELDQRRCIVFPNALAQSWIDSQVDMRQVQIARQLPQRFLLSVTRLASTERYKGIVSTIESLASLSDKELHYVVAGKGDDIDFLQRVARRCGVYERVHFSSGLSDMELAALYRRALAFVLPSGKEGFGIVYLEAMYFGVPVIAARARGAVDVVRDEETGLLVEYGDVTAIARAIDRLSTDQVLRIRLTQAGKRLVTDDGEFTTNAMKARWAQLLGEPANEAVV